MKQIVISLSLALVLLVSACKTDDNNDGPTPTNGYRLTGLTWEEEGIIDENVTFSYNGDKVTGWTDISEENNEQYKAEISYPSDNIAEIVMSDYYETNSTWEIDAKYIYNFGPNGVEKVLDYEFNGNDYILNYTENYLYNGDGNIIESIDKNVDGGVEIPTYKKTFTYEGSLLAESVEYNYLNGEWKQISKTNYTYDNNILTFYISSYFIEAWQETAKTIFTYNGNKVTEVNTYGYVNGEIGDLSYGMKYNYDANGNITSTEGASSYSGSEITKYSYEAKSGNLSIFGFDGAYGYPNPIYSPKPNLNKLFNKQARTR